jgi:hypothetical protein
VLVDGAGFFRALRRAFINAQRSIFIVGWDNRQPDATGWRELQT